VTSALRKPRPGQPAMLPAFAHIQRFWDPQLDSWNVKILPGEYYVTRGEEAISTVLGSCISACVRDPVRNVGGMNHFMLPEDASTGPNNWLDPAIGLATRYGSYAMESLINDLLYYPASPMSALATSSLYAAICSSKATGSWRKTWEEPNRGRLFTFRPADASRCGVCALSKTASSATTSSCTSPASARRPRPSAAMSSCLTDAASEIRECRHPPHLLASVSAS
jgi:hypothetical protein